MKTVLLALFIIIIIDLFTGIRKAHYTEGVLFRPLKKEFWKVIKSKELRKTWRKTVACLVEIYSVYENMEAVSGNNLFKKILEFLPRTFKSSLKNEKK